MIPSTLLYIALLPIILADLNILVLVPDEFKDSARVSERQAFGEEAAVYNRTWGNPGSGSLCPNTAKCKTKYAGVVWIGFSKTTEDPRNVNVTMGQERFVVSQELDSVNRANSVV